MGSSVSAWGNSFGSAFGFSFGAPMTRPLVPSRGSYNTGDDNDDVDFINQQNRMLITTVVALVASGALG